MDTQTAGYQNKLLGAIAQMDYIRPAVLCVCDAG